MLAMQDWRRFSKLAWASCAMKILEAWCAGITILLAGLLPGPEVPPGSLSDCDQLCGGIQRRFCSSSDWQGNCELLTWCREMSTLWRLQVAVASLTVASDLYTVLSMAFLAGGMAACARCQATRSLPLAVSLHMDNLTSHELPVSELVQSQWTFI